MAEKGGINAYDKNICSSCLQRDRVYKRMKANKGAAGIVRKNES